ncbi:alpha/beta fold hydrolase [Deinococcus koreensis]|uniref:Alpha/beta hydrolase n=1 Tax=Deinococcus koreensis TaxID=2054903 RepID=A0A2K3UTX7_9DEIO|nr:alpha/beta hydrolase [Deinococcus koreensis]PNY79989.1 alpha/beta hydrolase [Deinococcus koreensis]
MSGVHALFLQVRGLQTHAWVRGEGRPLVIVPGLGCASWMYVRVARELARERRVYVYDPPGHGHSEGSRAYPATIEDLTDHLAAWLEVAGLHRAAIFGHSLGGEVIFDLMARYPGCAGALIACAPTGIPENPSVPVQVARLLRDLPRERLGLVLPGLHAYARCGARRMLELAGDQARHDTGPLLGQIRAPTLLLDGLYDPVIRSWTVQAIQTAIPDAVIRQIRGGTHALTDTFPRTVARYSLDFLKDADC